MNPADDGNQNELALGTASQSRQNRGLQVAVVTLFPELFDPFLTTSFVGRAQNQGLLSIHLERLRDQGLGRHKSIDDTPYGGGAGMVMRVDCTVAAIENAETICKFAPKGNRVLLTPQGAIFNQSRAHQWVRDGSLVLNLWTLRRV